MAYSKIEIEDVLMVYKLSVSFALLRTSGTLRFVIVKNFNNYIKGLYDTSCQKKILSTRSLKKALIWWYKNIDTNFISNNRMNNPYFKVMIYRRMEELGDDR